MEYEASSPHLREDGTQADTERQVQRENSEIASEMWELLSMQPK